MFRPRPMLTSLPSVQLPFPRFKRTYQGRNLPSAYEITVWHTNHRLSRRTNLRLRLRGERGPRMSYCSLGTPPIVSFGRKEGTIPPQPYRVDLYLPVLFARRIHAFGGVPKRI